MGRNAGGVVIDGNKAEKGVTERGYTEKMMKNIVGKEDEYADAKIEYAHIFTENGDFIKTKSGEKDRVNLGDAPENAIVTHNHPLTKSERADQDLVTFSSQDLQYAVNKNLKEIRVRTEFHTFSMRKIGTDWGEKARKFDIDKTYRKKRSNYAKEDVKRVRALIDQGKYKEALSLQKKLDGSLDHRAMKDVAKFYGWNYTMKKE